MDPYKWLKDNQLLFLLVTRDLCHLLMTFVNSLDPDQAWQNIKPDLDPNYLTLMKLAAELKS